MTPSATFRILAAVACLAGHLAAYLGATCHISADNVQWQAGLVYARGEDTPACAPLTVETLGLRPQLQVNF